MLNVTNKFYNCTIFSRCTERVLPTKRKRERKYNKKIRRSAKGLRFVDWASRIPNWAPFRQDTILIVNKLQPENASTPGKILKLILPVRNKP